MRCAQMEPDCSRELRSRHWQRWTARLAAETEETGTLVVLPLNNSEPARSSFGFGKTTLGLDLSIESEPPTPIELVHHTDLLHLTCQLSYAVTTGADNFARPPSPTNTLA
jgi:hypothetical protein